jgi:hypothetical protein
LNIGEYYLSFVICCSNYFYYTGCAGAAKWRLPAAADGLTAAAALMAVRPFVITLYPGYDHTGSFCVTICMTTHIMRMLAYLGSTFFYLSHMPVDPATGIGGLDVMLGRTGRVDGRQSHVDTSILGAAQCVPATMEEILDTGLSGLFLIGYTLGVFCRTGVYGVDSGLLLLGLGLGDFTAGTGTGPAERRLTRHGKGALRCFKRQGAGSSGKFGTFLVMGSFDGIANGTEAGRIGFVTGITDSIDGSVQFGLVTVRALKSYVRQGLFTVTVAPGELIACFTLGGGLFAVILYDVADPAGDTADHQTGSGDFAQCTDGEAP